VYGAYKYTGSILHLLILFDSGVFWVFWVFWNLLHFLFACSAIILGDVIASKTKDSRRNPTAVHFFEIDSHNLTFFKIVLSIAWSYIASAAISNPHFQLRGSRSFQSVIDTDAAIITTTAITTMSNDDTSVSIRSNADANIHTAHAKSSDPSNPRQCKTSSVGQTAGLPIPRPSQSVRFRQIPPQQKNKNLSLHGFDLYRPSKKDTRLQFQVISAIINPAQLDKAPTIITKASR